ncbi:MAG: prolyl oligopeptidase family serine peptidase, partial [Promethearchaeati archaeon]
PYWYRDVEPCRIKPGPWSSDSTGFYLLSEEGLESMGLGFFDLETESFEWIQRSNWDIEHIAHSNDGSYLAWVSNEDGYSRLCVKDYERDRVYSPPLPDGVMGQPSFSKDGASLVFTLRTPRRPISLYISDWGQNRVARPITNGFLGRLDEEQLVEPNLIFYESEDGLKIPAFLYRPLMVDSTRGAAPVVISIHSKSRGQARPEYNASFQYLLNRGMGILAPNIRGSSGYGRTYESLILGDWGGEMVEDIKQGVEYLTRLDWVDGNRLGIVGRHFGGYAALISAFLLPNHFAAAVSMQGPCDLLDYIESLPSDSRNVALRLIGNPESERHLLIDRSPVSHVENTDLRCLIIQGAEDQLISLNTMDKFVEELSIRGTNVEYRVLPGVGHEFIKRKNSLLAWDETVNFLARNLLA